MSNRPTSKKAQKRLICQVVDNDALKAARTVRQTARDIGEISAFKLRMNDWLFERRDVLDYYGLVDAVNASIYAATDKKAAKMGEWRAWQIELGAALVSFTSAQDALGKLQKSAGRGSMGHALAVEAHAIDRDDAQEIIGRLKGGLVAIEPQWAETDESGQAFDDDNYLPFEPIEQ